jgi:competence protein ComEA
MGSQQTRRLLVYVAAALVVLVGGGWALLSARRAEAGDPSGAGAGSQGLTLSTAVGSGAAAGSDPTSGVLIAPTGSTTTTRRIWVQVVGAVNHPGVYPLPAGARTFDAIAAAGGVAPEGDEQGVPLAAVVGDGARVVVPKKGQGSGASSPGSGSAGVGTVGAGGGGTGSGSLPVTPLSLTDATLEQLDALPGIGPSTARQIVAYRDAHGPFTSVDQLDEVTGIGPATLTRLEGLVVP